MACVEDARHGMESSKLSARKVGTIGSSMTANMLIPCSNMLLHQILQIDLQIISVVMKAGTLGLQSFQLGERRRGIDSPHPSTSRYRYDEGLA